MVGRRSLIAVAATAFVFVGGQSAAFAATDADSFEQLVQVFVPNQDAVALRKRRRTPREQQR
jgi:hypothetical protein